MRKSAATRSIDCTDQKTANNTDTYDDDGCGRLRVPTNGLYYRIIIPTSTQLIQPDEASCRMFDITDATYHQQVSLHYTLYTETFSLISRRIFFSLDCAGSALNTTLDI